MNTTIIGELSEKWLKENDPNYTEHKVSVNLGNDEFMVPKCDIPYWIENGWKESEDLTHMVKGRMSVSINK